MNDIIYGLIIAALATFLPSPTDVWHFYLQNYLYTHRLSRGYFEFLQVFDWYFLDSLWFVFLIGVVLLFHIDSMPTVNALTVVFTILGVGAAVSIIWRFLRKHKR